ncbi:integrase core domain-containing protein [Halomonas binhaiensis]|uniref:Transposase family protein n=1 Tax=Halomonas binhaiensis TaxID=2562282 RepID=A0A5C1NLK7_9GAMM|nr:integrase core domain-containing protein [Halomonas binhaiensis]QEM83268.1 transposase family protein [Halomonas binhaiensis]
MPSWQRLLDHGSRACLRLSVLENKRSLTILRELIATFRRFGLPQRIRVDNEACFNSILIKAGLSLLGIHLQTIDRHCPWQNGRIERFFGTLKRHLDDIIPASHINLEIMMREFRGWYNHARPHQHLGGFTPAEVWEGRAKSTNAPQWISIWDGRINGWWFPP